MNRSFELFIWGIVTAVIGAWMVIKLLSGGLISYAEVGIVLVPYIFIVFLRNRSKWHIFPFAFLPLDKVWLRTYGMEKLTPLYIFLAFALLTMLLDGAMRSRNPLPRMRQSTGSVLMRLFLLIAIGRFLYKPPGFAGLGASQGGFFAGVAIINTGAAYFLIRREKDQTRRGLHTARQKRHKAGAQQPHMN